jgi:hypothetical protein
MDSAQLWFADRTGLSVGDGIPVLDDTILDQLTARGSIRYLGRDARSALSSPSDAALDGFRDTTLVLLEVREPRVSGRCSDVGFYALDGLSPSRARTLLDVKLYVSALPLVRGTPRDGESPRARASNNPL